MIRGINLLKLNVARAFFSDQIKKSLFNSVYEVTLDNHFSIWEIILISNFILSKIRVTHLIQFYGKMYFFLPMEKHTPHTFVLFQRGQLFSTSF